MSDPWSEVGIGRTLLLTNDLVSTRDNTDTVDTDRNTKLPRYVGWKPRGRGYTTEERTPWTLKGESVSYTSSTPVVRTRKR